MKSTEGDPLAAFAMATGKSYVFGGDATAAIAYRALGGFAVVSGDPIGNPARYGEVVRAFAALCRARGRQIAVIGASTTRLTLWQNNSAISSHLTAVPIGRDVVIQVGQFNLTGRRKRNLRQAVQRTRNAGVTTEVVTVDMISWAKERGMQRVSLAFAPFPDLFACDPRTSAAARALRDLAHLLDRFIKLESLYRYLRKFDAMGEQRYVLIPLTHVVAAAGILLTLEFRPHRDPCAVHGSMRYISAARGICGIS